MGEAKNKNKGCRSTEEINRHYSALCGQLGDYTYRRQTIAKEIEKIQRELAAIDIEAFEAKKQEDARAKATPKDVREGSPADDVPPTTPDNSTAQGAIA